AISQALNKPLIDGLKALHPEFANRVRILQNLDFLSSQKGLQPKVPTPFDIAQRLKPQRISPYQLQQVLHTISNNPIFQQAALELMIRGGEIYSPRRVGMALEAIHQNIQEYAHQEKIHPQHIFYLLPTRAKSFTILAHQYQGIHQIPSKQFLVADETVGSSQALEKLMAQDPHQPKLFVVLDDLAGSGASYKIYMNREGKTLLEGHPNHTLYLCPVVSTQKALSNYFSPPKPTWDSNQGDSNGKVIFSPHAMIDGFTDTAYYQSLTPEEQKVFQALIQDEGFEKAMTQIVFPWMGTDTNNRFWAKFMVNPHTLNGKGNRPQAQANLWKRIEEEDHIPQCVKV
ncbi:MAG: hypothetical protein K2X66_05940, partial [Cyanobacteria bacterium]|nr:hypothetical protein [Cyanobacteriota bacterium]